MNLKQSYFKGTVNMALDALRMGYYSILEVVVSELKYNKQQGYAYAYWHPETPDFSLAFKVKANLSSLGNHFSEGPKELFLNELNDSIIHIISNNLINSPNPAFRPTYKIIWTVLDSSSIKSI